MHAAGVNISPIDEAKTTSLRAKDSLHGHRSQHQDMDSSQMHQSGPANRSNRCRFGKPGRHGANDRLQSKPTTNVNPFPQAMLHIKEIRDSAYQLLTLSTFLSVVTTLQSKASSNEPFQLSSTYFSFIPPAFTPLSQVNLVLCTSNMREWRKTDRPLGK